MDKETLPQASSIQQERFRHSWSQQELADKIGTTRITISRWERGTALPGAYYRQKLCTLFEKTPEELGLMSQNGTLNTIRESELHQPAQEETDASSEESHTEEREQFATRLDMVAQIQGPSSHPLYLWLKRKRMLWMSTSLALVIILLGGALIIMQTGIFTSLQADPYPPYKGQLVLNDTLHAQNSNENWQEGLNDQQASCVFAQQGYVAFQPLAGHFHACVAQKTDYTNFAYEVVMTIEQGEFGGIVFRSEDSIDDHFYLFRIHTDGSYWLYRFIDRNIDHAILLQHSSTQAFHTGSGKSNLIAVVAQGSSLTLYVNRQQVCELQDAGYTHGQIGVLAGSLQQAPSQALYEQAKVWTW